MLGTFITESILLLYVLFRYKITLFARVASVLIFCLAMFQLSEYQICGNKDFELWAAVGFTSITFLPVLGYHLISIITEKRKMLVPLYAMTFVVATVVVLSESSIVGAVCTENYLVFIAGNSWWWVYTIFYFGVLLLGIVHGLSYLKKKKIHEATRGEKALFWILVGYASFLVPMAIVYIYFPEARHAVPSVMCGFAVFLALILTFKVLPKREEA